MFIAYLDTAQAFRVESNPTITSSNGGSEATSSPQTTSITSTLQTTSIEPVTSSQQSVPISQPTVTHSSIPQVTQPQPVQYIPSPSTTIIIPTNQYGVPPQLVPQVLSNYIVGLYLMWSVMIYCYAIIVYMLVRVCNRSTGSRCRTANCVASTTY